jgi:hypothetical protein
MRPASSMSGHCLYATSSTTDPPLLNKLLKSRTFKQRPVYSARIFFLPDLLTIPMRRAKTSSNKPTAKMVPKLNVD